MGTDANLAESEKCLISSQTLTNVAKDGKVASYRGRTSIKIVWNLSQNAPELVVEAFPWED